MQLRRQVAEIRRDVQHLMQDTERQDRNHHELRTAFAGMDIQRVQTVLADLEHLKNDTARQDRNLDDCAAWFDGWARELDLWVQCLAATDYPKAQTLPSELRRIFPQGFGVIPNYRLGKKTPHKV
jgi:hypothetical protein